ncbi:hypothetical protein, partial [Nocardia farcinica]|uniref:hypothetical protein n=1 Tax=Nocardia farcinica TaxID=37329 RepID=UPI0024584E3B
MVVGGGGAPGAVGAADLRAIVALTVPSAAAVAAVTDRLTACARTVLGLSTPAAEADRWRDTGWSQALVWGRCLVSSATPYT